MADNVYQTSNPMMRALNWGAKSILEPWDRSPTRHMTPEMQRRYKDYLRMYGMPERVTADPDYSLGGSTPLGFGIARQQAPQNVYDAAMYQQFIKD